MTMKFKKGNEKIVEEGRVVENNEMKKGNNGMGHNFLPEKKIGDACVQRFFY